MNNLETQISPIFGLSLLEHLDILTIISAVGSIIIAGTIIGINYWQTRKKIKVDSARFLMDYVDKILEEKKDVINTIYDREKNSTVKFKDDQSIIALLNKLDNIIKYLNDGILDKDQVLNMLKILLGKINTDSEIQRIIQETQVKSGTAFKLIKKFMDEELK